MEFVSIRAKVTMNTESISQDDGAFPVLAVVIVYRSHFHDYLLFTFVWIGISVSPIGSQCTRDVRAYVAVKEYEVRLTAMARPNRPWIMSSIGATDGFASTPIRRVEIADVGWFERSTIVVDGPMFRDQYRFRGAGYHPEIPRAPIFEKAIVQRIARKIVTELTVEV